jgi:hypothetical protein
MVVHVLPMLLVKCFQVLNESPILGRSSYCIHSSCHSSFAWRIIECFDFLPLLRSKWLIEC